ncbi:MAG TPA: signal peptidase I [Candidatus Acidoferrum sp.]|nr:signal peptidase I [Candidatus Acidoferrum sp.]
MNIDFSLVLVVLSAVTGVVWLVDAVMLAKPRREDVAEFLKGKGLSQEEFNAWVATLDDDGKPQSGKEGDTGINPVKLKHLQEAFDLNRYPIVVDYSRAFFPILFAVLLLRSFLFEPFQIPTGSMIPTLDIGDFIVVNKFAYGLRLPVTGTKIFSIGEPKRGDIMVFVPPHVPDYYIKRVIGLPGDHIQYKDNVVYVNGEPLPQDPVGVVREKGVMVSRETVGGVTHDIYTAASQHFSRVYDWLKPEGMVIPEGSYFMMGDNRDNSLDSRFWGPASEAKIVGKAVAVWMHKDPGLSLPSFAKDRWIENSR